MSPTDEIVPIVMSFAGLDPTGGAGLQADIEAISSMGCHTAPVITASTVQSTGDVLGCVPMAAINVVEQARAVLSDMPVAGFKIGLLPSAPIVEAIATLLGEYPDVPVVVDPIQASGSGTTLVDDDVLDAMVSLLFPRTTVLTPNGSEARALAPEADSRDAMAQELMSYGCRFVLITGADDMTKDVLNTLHTDRRRAKSFRWPRLPHSYHGSGCTLASAIAALLAQGSEPINAIATAQEYTWASLKWGRRLGLGQHLPNRLYWAHDQQYSGE